MVIGPMWSSWTPCSFSDSAVELCLTLKALFNLPLRQATGLVASLLKLIWTGRFRIIRHCVGVRRRFR